jgi:hypothetical protein
MSMERIPGSQALVMPPRRARAGRVVLGREAQPHGEVAGRPEAARRRSLDAEHGRADRPHARDGGDAAAHVVGAPDNQTSNEMNYEHDDRSSVQFDPRDLAQRRAERFHR